MDRVIGFRGVGVDEMTDTPFTFMIETDRAIASSRLLAIASLMSDVHTVVRSPTVMEFFPAMWAFSTIANGKDVFVRLPLAIDLPTIDGYSPFNDGTTNASTVMSMTAKLHAGCFIHECLGVDLERDLFLETDDLNGFGRVIPYQALYRGLVAMSGLANDMELNTFAGLMNGTYGNFNDVLGCIDRKNYFVPQEATRFRCPDLTNPLMGWMRNVWSGFDNVTIRDGIVSWPVSFLVPLPVLMRQCGYYSCPMILPRACRLTLSPAALRVFMPGLKLATAMARVPMSIPSRVGQSTDRRFLLSAKNVLSVSTAPLGSDEPVYYDLANALTKAFMSAWTTTKLTADFSPPTMQAIGVWTVYVSRVMSRGALGSYPILRFMDSQFGDVAIQSSMTIIEIGLTGDSWREEALARVKSAAQTGVMRKCGAFSLLDHGFVKPKTAIRGGTVSLLGMPRYERLAVGAIPRLLLERAANPTLPPDESVTADILANMPYLFDTNTSDTYTVIRPPLVVAAVFNSSAVKTLWPFFYPATSAYTSTQTGASDWGAASRGGYRRAAFETSNFPLVSNAWSTASQTMPTIVNGMKPENLFEALDLDNMTTGGETRVKLYRAYRSSLDSQVSSRFWGFRVGQLSRVFATPPLVPKGSVRYWYKEQVHQNFDTAFGGSGMRTADVRHWWFVDMIGTERKDLPCLLPTAGVLTGTLTYRLTTAAPFGVDQLRLVTISFGRVTQFVNDTAMVAFADPNGVSSVTNCLFNCV